MFDARFITLMDTIQCPSKAFTQLSARNRSSKLLKHELEKSDLHTDIKTQEQGKA